MAANGRDAVVTDRTLTRARAGDGEAFRQPTEPHRRTDDAWLTMPPEPLEYHGGAAIGRFLSTVPAGGALERLRLVATRANSQPAFACYLNDPVSPIARAYGPMVLTLEGDRVSAITGFPDTSVFPHFGLPRTLRA
jgi:hypothetical protein